ncbi:hypothetical protein, partial [Serratia marcescens]
MLKLNGLMMGLNIKKVSSLIRLEGEVRKDGQANGGAYPIIKFNIIYIMRTSAQIRQKSACNHHHGIKRSSLLRSFVFD